MICCIEGPDMVGKTTLIKNVRARLLSSPHINKDVIVTREPGGSDIGNKIRDILFNDKISKKAELLLFLTDRAEHQSFFKEHEDKIILLDRYDISTIVYQSYLKDTISPEGYFDLAETFGFIQPDLYVYLTADEPITIDRKEDDFISLKDDWKKVDNYYEKAFRLIPKKKQFRLNSSHNTSEQNAEKLINKLIS